MSSIKDVARYAGVSSATVSRVLANKPYSSEDTRSRVLAAVKALGYRPNRIARSLRVRRSSVVGLVISDIQNSFFNTVVTAIEDKMRKRGYGVFLCNSNEDTEREQLYLNLLLDEQVAGIILTPTQQNPERYKTLLESQTPLTLIDRQVTNLGADTVITDNAEAAFKVMTSLINKGHTRIGAVLSDPTISTSIERLEGYKRALKKADLPFEKSLVRFGSPVIEEGYALTQALLTQPEAPTGLFSGSKLLTLGMLKYLFEHDINVPADLGLGVFDSLDWLPNQPEMIVAEQPAYALGETAAKLLLERIENPEKNVGRIVLPSSIKHVKG